MAVYRCSSASWGDYAQVDGAADASERVAYLDHFASLPPVRKAKERSFELLEPRPGARFLDVGCGGGQDLRALERLTLPGGAAVGVDHSEIMIAEARRRGEAAGSRASYLVADAVALPFEDASFDGCRADRVLQHLDEPLVALAEMERVTRPGGRMVLSEATTSVADGGPLAEVTHRLMLRAAAGHRTWAGYFLPALARRAGFVEVAIKRDVGLLTEPKTTAALLDARQGAEALIKAGDFERAAIDQWLRALPMVALKIETLHLVIWARGADQPRGLGSS